MAFLVKNIACYFFYRLVLHSFFFSGMSQGQQP